LQSLLEQQLERLPTEVQRILRVASVVGMTFAAATVAAGLEAEVLQVERHCQGLVRRDLLREAAQAVWPDGTTVTCYEFTHALYQQVAHAQLGVGQRAQLHHRIAVRLETAYAAQAGALAAELAVHFEHSGDLSRAVRYWHRAGINASQRHAPQDAGRSLRRALKLLAGLPDTPERTRLELDVLTALGPAVIATQGYAALEWRRHIAGHGRCVSNGATPRSFSPYYGDAGSFPWCVRWRFNLCVHWRRNCST
jgi:predicted ATPase